MNELEVAHEVIVKFAEERKAIFQLASELKGAHEAIVKLSQDIQVLREIVWDLRRGGRRTGCWCEVEDIHIPVQDHSGACQWAQALWKGTARLNGSK